MKLKLKAKQWDFLVWLVSKDQYTLIEQLATVTVSVNNKSYARKILRLIHGDCHNVGKFCFYF